MDLFELSAKIGLETGDYEKSVKEAAEKAENVEDSLKDAGKAAEKTEDSFDGLGKTSKKTSKETEGLGKSTDNVKESFFGSLVKADLFSDALKKAGEIALEVASYIWNLDEATEEYRVSQTKLNTAFKVAGFGASTAKNAFSGLYRAVGDIDRATEASQLLSQLAQNTQDVADWTTIATGVVGTFGDSLPIESLIESANETARVGKVTGTLADALNWAGMVGEDEFNVMLSNCETQEERVKLITETLMDTYSEAATTFEETSASVMQARDAFLAIEDASSQAGQSISELKTEMGGSAQTQFASQGFFGAIKDATGWLTNLSKGTKTNTDLVREWLKTVETRIDTGSIEEATEAFEELGRYIDYAAAHPIDSIFQLGGIFTASGVSGEVDRLLGNFRDRFGEVDDASENAADGMNNAADAAENLDNALEPVVATAGGVSVAIEGTSMTAEEASSRLKTYTDAATNMFDQISTESELSYQDVLDNIQHNFQAVNDFANNMQTLAGVLPPAMYETLAAGGPQMYAGVVEMLAEANTGANEGLPELQRLFEAGGDAAVKAFVTSLGAVPENVQDPAKIVAAQMEQDTSMETSATAVATRSGSAFASAIESSGFDTAGEMAIQQFANGMSRREDAVESAARSASYAASSALQSANFYQSGRDAIQQFINGMESKRGSVRSKASSISNDAKPTGGGSGRAGGLDIVPYNGYPAILHAGEAVLTAREAKEWRAGGTDNSRKIVINQYIQTIPQTPAQLAAASEAYFEQAVWSL